MTGACRPNRSREELIEKQNTVERYLSTNVLVKWSACLYFWLEDILINDLTFLLGQEWWLNLSDGLLIESNLLHYAQHFLEVYLSWS